MNPYPTMVRYFGADKRMVTLEVRQTGENKWSLFKTKASKTGKTRAPAEIFTSPCPIYIEYNGLDRPVIRTLPSTEKERMLELVKAIFKYRRLEELVFEIPITFGHVYAALQSYRYRGYYDVLEKMISKPKLRKKVFCVLFGQPKEYVQTLEDAVNKWNQEAPGICEKMKGESKREFTEIISRRLYARDKQEIPNDARIHSTEREEDRSNGAGREEHQPDNA